MSDQPLDCVIIGGGPAGLTAALYLARFNRSFVVIDAGDPRAAWIPTSHNIPFFPEGISGPDMLKRLTKNATQYGAEIMKGEVTRLEKTADGFVTHAIVSGVTRSFVSRFAFLATGADDIEPDLPNVPDAVHRGLVRYCPICDGYEAQGKKIAVIGHGEQGLGEAIFVARTYSSSVTLLTLGKPMELTPEEVEKTQKWGIRVIYEPIGELEIDGSRITAIRDKTGKEHSFEVLYSALGLKKRTGLARALGADVNDKNGVLVDDHYQTSIPGLYAAGGCVRGLDQVVVAMGQAAVAATEIHNCCERPSDPDNPAVS